MLDEKKKLRAIDLYSGVGGWSLGLRLAGIEVVASYERWGPANETNFKNNLHQAQIVDIRRLAFEDLPTDVDIVVGSPPCTQFSFSNRGGSGDIADGLEDIIRFLTIVDYLRPQVWAMENVPRVAKIIEHELKPEGCLHQFQHLGIEAHVINMEDYGLPQRRRRCIAGNFDHNLLTSYAKSLPGRTLADVVKSLAADSVVDPLFGLTVPKSELRDHVQEDCLNAEETRINRANKTLHTVYNAMPFPDRLGRSVRTITATCTRVSRESIVIEAPEEPGAYRRLTIRERASLQGFPVTFQFYGASFSQKMRMVGNAIPPSFAYLVGQVFKGVRKEDLPDLKYDATMLAPPSPFPIETPPDRPGARFPRTRNFRFAIPNLQLKSGVRFELANDFKLGDPAWRVSFYFGNSKSIQTIQLDGVLFDQLRQKLPGEVGAVIIPKLDALALFIREADVTRMQTLWAHRGVGRTRAFMLLDEIDDVAAMVVATLEGHIDIARILVAEAIEVEHGEKSERLPGMAKLARHAPLILAGMLIGSIVNRELSAYDGPITQTAPERNLS